MIIRLFQVRKAAKQTLLGVHCRRCVVMDKEIVFLSRVFEGESISFTWI